MALTKWTPNEEPFAGDRSVRILHAGSVNGRDRNCLYYHCESPGRRICDLYCMFTNHRGWYFKKTF